ncbi:Y-family DNA polymerase [Ulvibacter litoralis]|uniref:DNA polymerase V n=1 Tax=Ulvibacter litoralis TaxID=227084 RepID=A0A1G7HJ64_9FLAO|nr:Y-family DNA polymerase [Ulvibacter litoralis]GHC58047.1 SOS mutagenesis and repair protein UmuC [Ulvibacter litoralis]SDF00522.1 DNA polymerase V [Ulvibacter litoralis]
MIAMVDCNSFYASCEQVFRPDLWGKPVVVLSNNDGCVIAANKEAKELAHIPMFEPVFKIKDLLIKNKVSFFSSNYTLYGEMSQRVMNILTTFSPQVEVYSIDEAFVDLFGMKYVSLTGYGHQMKDAIYKNTGLPVGVGIAPTKVLAKLANRISKKVASNNHVFVIDTEQKRVEALQWAKIGDVWGIGRKHAKRLQTIGVHTAYDFTNLPLAWVRKEMTVVGERMWREMNGESCLEFTTLPKPKKGIGTAKSFGQKLEDIGRIEEACAYYISEVSEVLRAQKSCATYVQVFLHTNYHSNIDKQYSNSVTVTLEVPTNNTFMLISEARKALRHIYKPGYRYKKVGVNLSGIIPQEYVQGNLFHQPSKLGKKELIAVFDTLNNKYGKSTVASAMIGTRMNEWELIKKERSPRYTTQWGELLVVKTN